MLPEKTRRFMVCMLALILPLWAGIVRFDPVLSDSAIDPSLPEVARFLTIVALISAALLVSFPDPACFTELQRFESPSSLCSFALC